MVWVPSFFCCILVFLLRCCRSFTFGPLNNDGVLRRRRSFLLKSSDDDNAAQDWRRQLEAAWNAPTMGVVPTDPSNAAHAAATALRAAMKQQKDETVFFVQILLPQYDSTAGSKVYDEVLAVEFCIAFAQELSERQSQILVRDDRILQTVQRILDARERDDDDDKKDSVAKDEEETMQDEPITNVEDFREKLMTTWETLPTVDPPNEGEEATGPQNKESSSPQPHQNYRLASLLGDFTDSPSTMGPLFMNKVIQAVSANARALPDEDTVLILNPSTKEELVGIRALAAKYQKQTNKKTMVLINCQLDPLPVELTHGITVYSILPLLGRPTKESGDDDDTPEPRVVVLRRFPRDWELFVDVKNGKGFALAATVSPAVVVSTGPSMEWVAHQVEQYLQTQSSN